MKTAHPLFAAALVLSLAACSGSGTRGASDAGAIGDAGTDAGADAGSDAGTPGDAGSADGGDGGPAACTATSDYGTVDAGENQFATYSPPDDGGVNDDAYQYQGQLNEDPLFDYIDMELYSGYGAFSGDGGTPAITTGTFTLGGDDLNYATCGLCVLIFTDTDPTTLIPTDTYMATGGTVTITTLAPTMTGTFTNMTFTHVNIDMTSFQSTPVGDGCNSLVESMPFSADVSDAGQ